MYADPSIKINLFCLFIYNLNIYTFKKMSEYIYAIEEFVGAKVSSVSTSPERDDTILVENPFDI